jgi:hypothetical protein
VEPGWGKGSNVSADRIKAPPGVNTGRAPSAQVKRAQSATLPAMDVAVWLALLTTPVYAQAHPVQAVADRLGVHKATAARAVQRLQDAGVVRGVQGHHRLRVALPVAGMVLHDHAPDVPCPGYSKIMDLHTRPTQTAPRAINDLQGVCRTVMPAQPCNKRAASAHTSTGSYAHVGSVEVQDHDLLVRGADDTTPDRGCTMVTGGKGKGLAGDASLRKLAAVYSAPATTKGGRPVAARKVASPEDLLLLDAYTARRRRLDPLYEPRPGDRVHMAKLARLLRAAGVPVDDWRGYMDWTFGKAKAASQGRLAFPPPAMAAAPGMVDNYMAEHVATHGARRLDVDKAERMLHGAGYRDVYVPMVVDVARLPSVRRGGPLPDGLDARTQDAVRWLAPRIAEVGYKRATTED